MHDSRPGRCGHVVLFGVLATAILDPSLCTATHVVVRVLNITGDSGTIRVALCRQAEWASLDCSYGSRVAARAGIVDVNIDVTPGVYAVLAHHDANGDDRINKNFFGIPVEGVGFSRNAPIRFGLPPFAAVSLLIDGDEAAASVSLIFEPSGATVNEQ